MLQTEEQRTLGVRGVPRSTTMPAPASPHTLPVRPRTTDDVDVFDAEVAQEGWLALLEASQAQPLSRIMYGLVIKRFCDFVAAAVLLVMVVPLFILVSLILRVESPGQVIFRQTRIGRGGQPFTIYKFRTMIPDRRSTQTQIGGEDRRKRHKTQNDPRVTRVGRFLRGTSIDELPQLYNILRGDMSFVGPRPELPEIVCHYQDWQHHRHLVTPGLSGWWQVHGRSDLPMHENTDMDIYYVVHQSFRMDLHIVLRTFRILIARGGAF